MRHSLSDPRLFFSGPFAALSGQSRWGYAVAVLLSVGALSGCKDNKPNPEGGAESAAEARDPVTGLTTIEAAEVLAEVGETKITLGQYAESLARMDRFERARYQSEERQKELLDEMIQVELLAQEARRRGLDKDPEVQLRIQQALRDELLLDLKRKLEKPEELSEREVREYYDAHRDEFKEPLRHRVQVISVGNQELAATVAEKAVGSSGQLWGELAKKYSLIRRGLGPEDALELAGDLGLVSAPGEKRGENIEVPEEVRAAAFTLKAVGDVAPEPVKAGDRYYIVRLSGMSAARDRTVVDADRTIRTELLRLKFIEAEKKLEAELRQRYPVVIDEARLNEAAAQSSEPKPTPAKPAEPKPSQTKPAPSKP